MCRVLNMSEFWIFANFRYYDRVQNMRRDTIMEEVWIFQDSEYARLLRIQALHKVLNMPEYGWMMLYDRVLNVAGELSTGFYISLQFQICQGSEYGKVVNMRGLHRVLNKPQWPSMWLTMPEYNWKKIEPNIPEFRICLIQYIAWGQCTNYWAVTERRIQNIAKRSRWSTL